MDDLNEVLLQLEGLGTKAEVKLAVLDALTKQLVGTSRSSYGFMLEVAFAYISGVREPSRQAHYSGEAVTKFKALWDGLPK
jgi:hypothetical protein